jgi:hypothetical protein
MKFFSIIAASMLATVALSAPVAEASPSTAGHSGSTELIDLWQDAYVPATSNTQQYSYIYPKIWLIVRSAFLGLKFTGSSTVGTCVELHGTGFVDNVTSGKSKPGFRCTVWVYVYFVPRVWGL